MWFISIIKARVVCTALAMGGIGLLYGESKEGASQAKEPDVPEPKREFRGVWISTAFNLDWPSKPGLPVKVQKEELLEIFDRSKELNLNAIVLQVRTMCDALYDSPIEPWSYYLTGELGKAPEPYYDPLAFAVEEAHKRGLELHAWINPFRAKTASYGDTVPDNHISKAFPWLMHKSGTHYWLDPSSEFVRNRITTIAYDLTNRYDIDGIHLDDYFYPYPRSGEYQAYFDDSENWSRYRMSGGTLDKNEWRRENINLLIEQLYVDIKRHRPSVKVGVSPSGIWKSGYPEKVKGLNAYSQIFVDSRKWLRNGWVDYLAPQLYWKMDSQQQSFSELYEWWQKENIQGRHVWPGISPSRIGSAGRGESDGRDAYEVLEQISYTRNHSDRTPGSGQIHWHWEAFATNRGGISKLITKKRYAGRALTPESPWLAGQGAADFDEEVPRVSGLKLTRSASGKRPMRLTWEAETNPKNIRWWCVQVNVGDSWWIHKVLPPESRMLTLDPATKIENIAVRAVDKIGALGEPSKARVKPPAKKK